MKKWLFVLIILLLVVGMFYIFMLQYDFGGETLAKIFKIDKSVTYPKAIAEYFLAESTPDSDDCQNIENSPDMAKLGIVGEVCVNNQRLVYQSGNNFVYVNLAKISKGIDLYEKVVLAMGKPIINQSIFTLDQGELLWFYGNYVIATQQRLGVTQEDGSRGYVNENFSMSNSVVRWFLDNYQPREL